MALTVVLFFAIVYRLLGKRHFNFKHPIDPLYFSIMTTSTVGLGDHVPQTQLAKTVVMLHLLAVIIGFVSFVETITGVI